MFARCRLSVLGSWSLLCTLLLVASSCTPPTSEPPKSKPDQQAEETPSESTSTTSQADHDAAWLTNFEAAKKQAQENDQFMLVDFTGSDWCGWCVKLKKEVFDKPEFMAEAPKQFVLVELDFPKNKKLPEKLKKQNEELAKHYRVRGFPTILLLDSAGEVIAKMGYQPGGPVKYLEHLTSVVNAFKNLGKLEEKLASVTGIDRAKLLDQLIDSYDKLGRESDEVETWSQEIIKLDADNGAGLKNKYEFRVLLTKCVALANEGDLDGARSEITKAIELPDLTNEQKQRAYWLDFQLCRGQKDLLGALVSLEKALEADPSSDMAKDIKKNIKQLKPLAEVLKLKASADKATGEDRAKILDELVEVIISRGDNASMKDQEESIEWSREIVSLDPENKLGLKNKHEFRHLMADAAKAFDQRDYDECRTAAEQAVAVPDLNNEQVQEANLRLGLCLREQEEYAKSLECFKKALDAAPNSAEADRIQRLIKSVEKEIEKAKSS